MGIPHGPDQILPAPNWLVRERAEAAWGAGDPTWAEGIWMDLDEPHDVLSVRDVPIRVTWEKGLQPQEAWLSVLCQQIARDIYAPPPFQIDALLDALPSRPAIFEAIGWAAESVQDAAGLQLPRPQRRVARIYVWDFTGCAAALSVRAETSGTAIGFGRPAPIGAAVAAALSRSKISGVRRRFHRAIRRSRPEASDAQQIVQAIAGMGAGAVATYLLDSKTERDGGLPLRGYIDWRDVDGVRLASSYPGWYLEHAGGPDRRRRRLSQKLLRELEADAFGTGIHSARGQREIISGDATADSELSPLDRLTADEPPRSEEPDLARRLEQLRPRLDKDELTLVDARLADPQLDLPAIAAKHGWDLGNTQAVWRRLRRKATHLPPD